MKSNSTWLGGGLGNPFFTISSSTAVLFDDDVKNDDSPPRVEKNIHVLHFGMCKAA